MKLFPFPPGCKEAYMIEKAFGMEKIGAEKGFQVAVFFCFLFSPFDLSIVWFHDAFSHLAPSC